MHFPRLLQPKDSRWLLTNPDYSNIRTVFLVYARLQLLGLKFHVTSRKVTDSIPDDVIGFFNLPIPSSRTMSLRSTQLLTEMSTRNLPGGKERPARKADNLTAICEPTV
jgi:hypothetical protein